MTNQEQKKTERTRTAVVVSRKMDKTAVVSIPRLIKHPLYQKLMRRSSKFKIHDPKNETRKGDVVLIVETRPISADKHWRLVKILKKAVVVEEAKV
jgi:small subunit ribosomal protein S17